MALKPMPTLPPTYHGEIHSHRRWFFYVLQYFAPKWSTDWYPSVLNNIYSLKIKKNFFILHIESTYPQMWKCYSCVVLHIPDLSTFVRGRGYMCIYMGYICRGYICMKRMKVKVLVIQSCQTHCDPMDCSPPGSSVHGVLQARILKWVAIPFFRGSSQSRDLTWVSCIARRFLTAWAVSCP